MRHPGPLDFERFAYDGLGPAAQAGVAEHLATCPDCRAAADRFAAERRTLSTALAAEDAPLLQIREAPRPARSRSGRLDRAAGPLVAAGLAALLFAYWRKAADEPGAAGPSPGWQIPVELLAVPHARPQQPLDVLQTSTGTLCVLTHGQEGGSVFIRRPGSPDWSRVEIPDWKFGRVYEARLEGETLHVLGTPKRGAGVPAVWSIDLGLGRIVGGRRHLPPTPALDVDHIRLQRQAGRWLALLGLGDGQVLCSSSERLEEWTAWVEVARARNAWESRPEVVATADGLHLFLVGEAFAHLTSADGLAWVPRPVPPTKGKVILARAAVAAGLLHLICYVEGEPDYLHFTTAAGGGGDWSLRSHVPRGPAQVRAHFLAPILLAGDGHALTFQWRLSEDPDGPGWRAFSWRPDGRDWRPEPVLAGIRGDTGAFRIVPGAGDRSYACVDVIGPEHGYVLFREYGPFPPSARLTPDEARRAASHARNLAERDDPAPEAAREILSLGRAGVDALQEALARCGDPEQRRRLQAWIERAEKAWAAGARQAPWWAP